MSLLSLQGRTRNLGLAAAAAGYMLLIAYALMQSPSLASGLVVLHVLLLISAPLLLWATRDEDQIVARVMVLGFALKLVGSLARYVVAFTVYGGSADAAQYDKVGAQIATSLRGGGSVVDLGGSLIGTRFIELLTGIVYTVTGHTIIGGFVVFSWFGFLGLLLFYRAFRTVYPHALAQRRRFAIVVFLMPSLLFWPSSIGKEAWMCLSLGLATYGVAGVLTQRFRGVPALAGGLLAGAVVRPHVVAAMLLAFGGAVFMGRRRGDTRLFNRVGLVAMVVLVVGSGLMLGRLQNYVEGKTGGESVSISDRLSNTVETTSTGGSEFTPVSAKSPLTLPLAAFSVLFRPLPFEASNPLALAASLEGSVLLVWIFRERRGLYAAARRIRDDRFVMFAAGYTVLFCVAFSSIANFGILVRERVQVLPLVLVLLCAPTAPEPDAEAAAADLVGHEVG